MSSCKVQRLFVGFVFVDKLPALYTVPDVGNNSSGFMIITNNNALSFDTSNMVYSLNISDGFYLTMQSSGGKLAPYFYGFPKWMNNSYYNIYNNYDTSMGFVFITKSEGNVILYY